MGSYVYTARDSSGKVVQGTQDAVNEYAAIKILQSHNLIITKIVETGEQSKEIAAKKQKKHRRIKTEDLLFFCRQTAILIEAGIPLLRSVEIIGTQCESLRLEDALKDLALDIKAGSSFKDAIAKNPRVFPSLWPFLIEAGEASGNLPVILYQLASHLEASINLKKKIVSALVYPAVLVFVAIGSILVFLLKIIPIFANLFKKFNAKLPALTQGVIDVSEFIQHYFILIFLMVSGAVYLTHQYVRTPQGKRNADRFVLKIPVVGNMINDSILARVCMNLATLVQSGVNLLESLNIVSRAAGNTLYEDALVATANDVQQGKPFSDSLERQSVFSPIMIHMIKVGEESGRLADMLTRVGKLYEDRVEVFVNRLSTLIEPAIMLIVGSVVGVLVVAMFLPILNLSSAIR